MNVNYVAFYQEIPIAISNKKKYLEIYMKKIRQLSKTDFYIYHGVKNREELYLEYYYGQYIPNRDISIIETEYRLFMDQLYNTKDILNELYKMLKIENIYSKNKNITSIILNILEIKGFILKEKNNDIIKDGFILNHDLFKCDIYEYIEYIKRYNDGLEFKKIL